MGGGDGPTLRCSAADPQQGRLSWCSGTAVRLKSESWMNPRVGRRRGARRLRPPCIPSRIRAVRPAARRHRGELLRYRLKMLLPDHLGLCELVDRRLDKSGRRLVLPNGLLQTLDHIGTQGHLAAPVADFSRYVVDQDQAVGHRQTVSDQLGAALTGSTNVTTHGSLLFLKSIHSPGWGS